MSTVGSTPAAWAWANWARPISPPAGHTAALLDMFWALKGATRSPRRANKRHSPATSVLLPAEDAVPCTMSTGARPLTTGDPRYGLDQALALLGQAAGDAHTIRQTERCTVPHHEPVRQQRATEVGAIADVDQNEVGEGRLDREPEVCQAVRQQSPRLCDEAACPLDVRIGVWLQSRQASSQGTRVDTPWWPHGFDRGGDLTRGEQVPEAQ